MTQTTTPASEAAEVTRCQAGHKSERPCWRPAAEINPMETDRMLCSEHMEVFRRDEDLDGKLHALEAVRAFLHSDTVERDPHDYLKGLALDLLETVTEAAATAAHRLRVAEVLADSGPEAVWPESSVMREYGAHLHARSDAISDAFAVVVDERQPSETERLAIVAVLKEAGRKINDEYDKFRAEQGLRG